MKCSIALLVFLLLVALPGVGGGQIPDEIKIATWNLEWFFDHDVSDNKTSLAKQRSAPSEDDFNWKLDAVSDAIAEMKPTIIALQEVENDKVVQQVADRLQADHGLDYTVCFVQGNDANTEQDVAILAQSGLVCFRRRYTPRAILQKNKYKDLTKHLVAEFEWSNKKTDEHLLLVVVHLVASGGESQRMRQGRVVRHWIKGFVQYHENVVVLGDFNSSYNYGSPNTKTSGVGIIRGLNTSSTGDDLYDLHKKLSVQERKTHLNGRQYDRILVSQSMITDEDYNDLVFDSIQRRADVVIRNGQDQSHGNQYWDIPQEDRDVSDHYPLIATFRFVD